MENIKSEFQSLQSKLATLRTPARIFQFQMKISNIKTLGKFNPEWRYNLKYFSSNYGLIIGCLSIYTLLTNLLLLFVIVLVVAGIVGINKLKGEELVTPFGSFKTNQLYTGLICVAVPIGFLASPISTLLWLIGASAVSVFGHASLMEKPIETVFDEETV